MTRFLLIALHLSGWKISTCLLRQYHYVAQPMTWTEAQSYCRLAHTDLATIESSEEMNEFIQTVSSAAPKVWMGLYSGIKWMWSDGYTGSGADYRNWETITEIEPDFGSANQFCVVMGSTTHWWDDGCFTKYPFICYNGSTLDPIYYIVNEAMDWSSAQSYCRDNFIDLATVRNDTDNLKIPNLAANTWAWIGLFRHPHIYWSDGSGSSFRNWKTGEIPLGWMDAVLCGVADLMNSGKWTLISCESRQPFVCHSIPQKRRVVKLRMKLGDSSLDLHDPAVKADILKKLQDKVEESGLSGVNLKWREQPDGRIFHKEGKRSERKQKREL